jgi:hypothetical protein
MALPYFQTFGESQEAIGGEPDKVCESIFERRPTMKKVKKVLSWCIPLVLITVALMTPAITQAGSIKIWPDQLKPQEPNSQHWQDVSMISNGYFYAPFTLPLGAKITKVIYYHEAEEAYTQVRIYRVKMGTQPESLAFGSSTDSTETIIPVEVVFSGDPIIRAGYRYYIWVYSGSATWFHGAKITYQE